MTARLSSPPSVRVDAAARPRRKPTDYVTAERTYPAPFRCAALEPCDWPLVRVLTSGSTHPDVLAAAGVAVDLERHTLGAVEVLDRDGVPVPRVEWLAMVRGARA